VINKDISPTKPASKWSENKFEILAKE
jgi:hypothetical protein